MAGRDRKNSLKALFGEPAMPAPETKSALPAGNPPADSQPPRATSGAVKAMGLSLSTISREAEEARALRKALEEGDRIVALDPSLIAESFVSDRLSQEEHDDPDFLALVESIGESGQLTPILVRPHPDQPDRFQVAYGHRRLKAARRLGVPVKAMVRTLSDSELVLAQGKENAERRNLTFIERALFARALVDRGFERKVACDALAVQKSELSRFMQVAEAVPEMCIRAVGPAPKAGRDRWMALAAMFVNDAATARALDEIRLERFAAASTDDRFQMLFERMSRRQPAPKAPPGPLKGPDGKVFARLQRNGRGVRITFQGDADVAFIESMGDTIEQAYARFVRGTEG